jgi:fibronectin-binding autotransporter adhesin
MKPRSIPSLTALASRFGSRQSAFLFVTAVVGLLSGAQVDAANRTWTGGGADDNWGTSLNWSVAPVAGQDTLVFAGNTRRNPNVNNLAADFAVTGLSFTNVVDANGNFSITGNRITLGGNITTSAVTAGNAAKTDSVNLAMILTANRTVTANTNHNINLLGIISGTGFGLTKAGAASLSLQGANTFTGAMTVNEGTLNISNGGSINASSGLTIGQGAIVTINNTSAANNVADRLNNAATITMNGGTFNFNNTAVASTNYSETAGVLSINALANTVNGGQAAATGTTAITFASLSRSAGAVVNFTGTSLGVDARNRILFSSAPTLTDGIIGGFATVGGTDWATYDGTNGVTALAPGSYTNDTWSAGNNTTVATSTAPSADSTTNSLRFNLLAANTVTLSGVNTITSGGILFASAVGANASLITGGTIQGSAGGELIVNQNNSTAGSTTTISSIIQDNTTATGLTKTGGGSLTLTGANTYTGVTTVSGGTLLLNGASETVKGNIVLGGGGRLGLGAANQIADTTVITYAVGAASSSRFQLNGFNETIGGIEYAAGVAATGGSRLIEAANDNTFNLPVSTLTINVVGSNTYSFGGLVRDAPTTPTAPDTRPLLAITKDGTGTQVFTNGSANYSGDTNLNGGVLRFTGTVLNTSEMKLNGGSVDFALAGTRTKLISGSSSSGGLIKSAAGVLTLSGVHTYSSPTSITGGTLALAAASSIDNSPRITVSTGATYDVSAVTGYTVGSAQTLAGNGNVTGAVSISGTHSPGVTGVANGVGSQTFSSTLNYGTGSIFEWNLSAPTTGAADLANGGTYDQVSAAGAITGGAAIYKVVLSGTSAFTDAFWSTSKSWNNVFTGVGAPANLAAVFTSFDPSGGLDSAGVVSGVGSFSFNNSTSTLNWTPVPEPSSALAGLLLGAGLLRRRRA